MRLLAAYIGTLCLLGGQTAHARDFVEAAGNNQIFSAQLRASQSPYMKGHTISMGWDDIEPQPGVWNWEKFDAQVRAATQDGLFLTTLIVYTGLKAPTWLYDQMGVVEIMTDDSNGQAGPYPWYLDPTYKTRFKSMLQNVIDHLDTFPPERRKRIVSIQAVLGKSGDNKPWDGSPTSPLPLPNGLNNMTSQEWSDFSHEMWLEYKSRYDATNPRIFVLANAGNDGEFHNWLHNNCPGFWRKVGHVAMK